MKVKERLRVGSKPRTKGKKAKEGEIKYSTVTTLSSMSIWLKTSSTKEKCSKNHVCHDYLVNLNFPNPCSHLSPCRTLLPTFLSTLLHFSFSWLLHSSLSLSSDITLSLSRPHFLFFFPVLPLTSLLYFFLDFLLLIPHHQNASIPFHFLSSIPCLYLNSLSYVFIYKNHNNESKK